MKSASVVWALGDIGVGLMAWLNIVAILLLQKPALKALRDYEAQKRAGREPSFDPAALGIANATFWEKREAAHGEREGQVESVVVSERQS
ncbi:alanine:cation symporter family protein [Burkholderia pyrrocinia]